MLHSRRSRRGILWLVALLALVLNGCGNSDHDNVYTAQGEQAPAASTATVRLQSVLAQAVPNNVDQLRATGFDSTRTLRYGPVTRDKAATVDFIDVPVTVTEFVIEYLAEDKVIGIARVQVSLTAAEVLTINNPDILGLEASVVSLAIRPAQSTIAAGTSAPLMATATLTDGGTVDLSASVEWSSSAPTIATVQGGLVRGLVPGEAVITASVGELTSSARVTVTNATLSAITITPSNPSIAKGRTLDLRVQGTFSDGSTQDITADVTWTSSRTEVASITGTGTVRGLAQGQSTIAATLANSPLNASAVLTVTAAELLELALTTGTPLIVEGTQASFVLTGTYTDNSRQDLTSAARFESSNTNVASVVSPGQVLAQGPGVTTIGASFGGGAANATLTVTSASVSAITVETVPANSPALIDISATLPLKALARLSNGRTQDVTQSVTWPSSNTSVATVGNTPGSDKGLVAGVARGQTNIRATLGGIEGTIAISVARLTPLPSLSVSSGSHTFNTDDGTYDGQPTAGWNPIDHRLDLDSFEIQAGATLTATGSYPFSVMAEGDISVLRTGRLARPGTAGVNGGAGGSISLSCLGSATVAGTVDCSGSFGGLGGGNGGSFTLIAGESIQSTGFLVCLGGDGGFNNPGSVGTVSGGAGGGRGGSGGTISLTSQGALFVASASCAGGAGGLGNPGGAVAGTTPLARGGDGGGNGGAGGTVTLRSQSTLDVTLLTCRGGTAGPNNAGGSATTTATNGFALGGRGGGNGGAGGVADLRSEGALTFETIDCAGSTGGPNNGGGAGVSATGSSSGGAGGGNGGLGGTATLTSASTLIGDLLSVAGGVGGNRNSGGAGGGNLAVGGSRGGRGGQAGTASVVTPSGSVTTINRSKGADDPDSSDGAST